MRRINIISVCGSGTVTSSMIANKVTDLVASRGVKANTTECNP
jgi:galactitol PTS system EIIB component